jgi:alkaline phosphatase D
LAVFREELTQPRREIRFGYKLPSCGTFTDFEGPSGLGIFLFQLADRLFKLIAATQSDGVILLSGDRHFGEISRLENPWGGSTLHELTTSGLTHSYRNFRGEKNSLRLGEPFAELNFGTVTIDWNNRQIELAIRDAQGEKKQAISVAF